MITLRWQVYEPTVLMQLKPELQGSARLVHSSMSAGAEREEEEKENRRERGRGQGFKRGRERDVETRKDKKISKENEMGEDQ